MSSFHMHARRGTDETHTDETTDLAAVSAQATSLCAEGWFVWIFYHEHPMPTEHLPAHPTRVPVPRVYAEYRPGESPFVYGFEGMHGVSQVVTNNQVA